METVRTEAICCCRQLLHGFSSTHVVSDLSVCPADVVITVCGTGVHGFAQGKCLGEAQFSSPYAACVDPIRPSNFYAGDAKSIIRYVDTESDTVSWFAGSVEASFDVVYGLVCASDGSTLYAIDYRRNRLHAVDVKSRVVTTVAGDGTQRFVDGIGLDRAIFRPRKLAFARRTTPLTPAEPAVLYITSQRGIRRFEVEPARMTCHNECWYDFWGIATTASGLLLLSCLITHSVYSFDPRTAKLELLAF